jgi:DNA polymerase
VAVTRERGRILDLGGRPALVTVHPSYILRIPDPAAAAAEEARFVDDLRVAADWLAAARPEPPIASGGQRL